MSEPKRLKLAYEYNKADCFSSWNKLLFDYFRKIPVENNLARTSSVIILAYSQRDQLRGSSASGHYDDQRQGRHPMSLPRRDSRRFLGREHLWSRPYHTTRLCSPQSAGIGNPLLNHERGHIGCVWAGARAADQILLGDLIEKSKKKP